MRAKAIWGNQNNSLQDAAAILWTKAAVTAQPGNEVEAGHTAILSVFFFVFF